jgi:choline dehydrogenase
VLKIYRDIEDWHGIPDPKYRGTGGPVFVEPAPNPNPIAPAMLEGARSVGIPTFENQNGRMMEGEGGASIIDVRARNGIRQSVFRSYVFPYMDRPNLTVLTHALVIRLIFEGKRVSGVEISYRGKAHRIRAGLEVVLSLGAIQTPKVLMQSGIGDQAELRRFGIPVVQHLPGVGQNLQDHARFGCIWEYSEALPPRKTWVRRLSSGRVSLGSLVQTCRPARRKYRWRAPRMKQNLVCQPVVGHWPVLSYGRKAEATSL